MSMIGTTQWTDALEPIARLQADAGMKELPDNREVLWTVKPSKKLTETLLEQGDIGPTPQFTGNLEYLDNAQGYKKTVTNVEYASGIKIQRIFYDTDQLDVVEGRPKLLGRSMRRRIAADSVFHLQNAFNAAYTVPDTLTLCNTAHTSNQPNITTTQSNTASTALSGPAVEAARIKMRQFLTNTDQRMEIIPDMLVVGVENEERAFEIIKTKGRVDTANNNVNFHYGRYKMLVDYRISGTKWFLIDSRLMKDYNTWFELTAPEFNKDTEFDSYAAKFSMYTAYSYVSTEWRWVYGNNPA